MEFSQKFTEWHNSFIIGMDLVDIFVKIFFNFVLIILKGLPNLPILVCVKNIGPKSENFIITIAIIDNGIVTSMIAIEDMISQNLFI